MKHTADKRESTYQTDLDEWKTRLQSEIRCQRFRLSKYQICNRPYVAEVILLLLLIYTPEKTYLARSLKYNNVQLNNLNILTKLK